MNPEPNAVTGPQPRLPTLQRNALCMLLGRRDYTPKEVAALDRAVLERAPRIGPKGIRTIREWLRGYGLDLAGAEPVRKPVPAAEQHRRRRLEKAIAVVRASGYGVVMPEDAG